MTALRLSKLVDPSLFLRPVPEGAAKRRSKPPMVLVPTTTRRFNASVTLATMTSAATKSAIVETSQPSAPAQMVPAASTAMEKVANTAEVAGQIAAEKAASTATEKAANTAKVPANTAMVKDANTANQIPANTAMAKDVNTANQRLANTATEKDANTANQMSANTATVRDANTAKENASAMNAAVKDADTPIGKAVVSSIATTVALIVTAAALNIPLNIPLVARIAAPILAALKVVQTMNIVPTIQRKGSAESQHRKPTQENAPTDSILEID